MQGIRDEKDTYGRLLLKADSLQRWTVAPTAVFLLGMLSLVILVWIYRFNDNLQMEFKICDALEDIQIKAASSHLWLEEFIAGNDTVDIRTVQADMDLAVRLADALLNGGPSEHGPLLQPIKDQNLRQRAEVIQALLKEFKKVGNQRLQDPQEGKIDSPLGQHFDALFKVLQDRVGALEIIIEKKHIRDQIEWKFYFIVVLIAWISAILIALTGLWRQEVRRKAVATTLQRTNEALQSRTEDLRKHEEHLQELVGRRTAELATANQILQQENVERKKAEESLMVSESRFRSLVEYLPLSISLKDRNSVYQYCNHACARNLEIEPEEIFGKTDRDFFPPEQAELHIAQDRRILDSGKAEETTERYLKHGQEAIVQKIKLSIKYGANGNGTDGLLCIVQDITEKSRLESIVEAANTMKNIGYIFAGVRHELGNPVNSTKITLRLLLSRLDTSPLETIREYIDRAMAEMEKMDYLLQTLKSFNMYETISLQDVPMQTFMERFLSLAAGDFKQKGILIRSHVRPEATSVMADPRALQQVLLNIMSNAADALEGRDKPEIVIDASKTDGFIKIQVTDNGCGMTEEQSKELFKPFHTTKHGGTGLGLVIAKKMLTGMKGAIAIKSREGTGTTVDIFLPGGPGGREGGRDE